MRERYVWDRKRQDLVPAEQYYAAHAAPRHGDGPMIIGDIAEYRSIVTGERIGGRRQHREHLARHGLVEVGNERPVSGSRPTPPAAGPDVKAAIEQLKSGNAGPPDERVNTEDFRMLA